jgi:hypothetical protein
MDEATLALPTALKDKTLHVFSLTDDGPSEFSLVVGRGDAGKGGSLQDFAHRLIGELRKSLPRFDLEVQKTNRIGDACEGKGVDAIELSYGWHNNMVPMRQRQTLTLVEGHAGQVQALMITATCTQSFDPKWHQVYDQVIRETRVHQPWPPRQAARAVEDNTPGAFALSSQKLLRVFSSVEVMAEAIDRHEALGGLWKFYDGEGQPLRCSAGPKSGAPVTFASAGPDSGAGPLLDRFALVDKIQGVETDAKVIKTHLQRSATRHA